MTVLPADVTAAAATPIQAARGRRGDGKAATGFMAPSMLGLLAFTAFPIVASLIIGFYNWPVIGSHTFIGLKNYENLLTSKEFHTAILNTFVFVLLYVPLNIVISLGLAVWIGSKTWAMPAVVMLSIWQGFGYNMLVFSAALDAVPTSLTEAAAIDGAGTVARFFRIVLPLITPSIFFAVVLTLISSFQVFTQAYVLTGGGPGNATTTMVVYLYEQGFQFYKMGLASAVAWVLFIIILVITVFQFIGQKRWVHYDQ
jgi:multiple sugar transport system permease protein